ncbi:MAG: hypothetical protein JWO67_6791 [Streptosporangiaceae bacterium]|nr:hypothetical protein [Streptosporangiaceae bacterium]
MSKPLEEQQTETPAPAPGAPDRLIVVLAAVLVLSGRVPYDQVDPLLTAIAVGGAIRKK